MTLLNCLDIIVFGLGGVSISVINDDKVMLDVKDIMKLTGIGRNNAYGLMKSGQFKVRKIGNKYLVHKDIYENWLKGETKPKKRRY